MNKVKRFTDVFAGFAAFSAFFYLFRQFMGKDFGEVEGMVEKIKVFFSPQMRRDYYAYMILIIDRISNTA